MTESPLTELVGIVRSMLGREIQYREVLILNVWLSGTQASLIRDCQETALKVLDNQNKTG